VLPTESRIEILLQNASLSVSTNLGKRPEPIGGKVGTELNASPPHAACDAKSFNPVKSSEGQKPICVKS